MSHDPDDLHGRQTGDRAMRKSTGRSLRTQVKIVAIDERMREAGREERAGRAAALLEQMHEERAEILMSISTCAAPSRQRWHDLLNRIDLEAATAEADLSALCQTIDRERESWATSAPDPAPVAPLPPLAVQVRRDGATPTVVQKITARKRELESWRQDVAVQLGLIVSSLHVLISTCGVYGSLAR